MSPVRVSQISGPRKAYMVVNLKARGINRCTRKLTRTPMLIKNNNNNNNIN